MTWWWFVEEEDGSPDDRFVITPFPTRSEAQEAVDYANRVAGEMNVPYRYHVLRDDEAKPYRGWYQCDGDDAATSWEEDVEDDFAPLAADGGVPDRVGGDDGGVVEVGSSEASGGDG